MLVKNWLSVIEGDRAIRVVTDTLTVSGSKGSIEKDYGDFELKSVKQDENTGRLILNIYKPKCSCYRIRTVKHYLTEYEKGFYAALHDGVSVEYTEEEEPYCFGTKNCDACKCGGDLGKCDYRIK